MLVYIDNHHNLSISHDIYCVYNNVFFREQIREILKDVNRLAKNIFYKYISHIVHY